MLIPVDVDLTEMIRGIGEWVDAHLLDPTPMPSANETALAVARKCLSVLAGVNAVIDEDPEWGWGEYDRLAMIDAGADAAVGLGRLMETLPRMARAEHQEAAR